MCRAGLRHCPYKPKTRDDHNRRRRQNRAERNAIATQARQEVGDDAYKAVLAMPPAQAKAWAHTHLNNPTPPVQHHIELGGVGGRILLDVPMTDIAPPEVLPRLTSPEFKNLLTQRNTAADTYHAVEATMPNGPTTVQESLAYHEALDNYRTASKALNEYRMETAAMLNPPTLTEKQIVVGDGITALGEAESGSREWLQMRQNTLGGSDVGAIAKVGDYGATDYDKVRQSKLDRDPQDQEHSGLALVGDQWEPVLISRASTMLGQEIVTDKTTFSNGRSHANLDGYVPNADGGVGMVVECKTGSHPEDWEHGAPPGYVLQVEHYQDFHGADKGIIIANLNDERFVVVEVTPDTMVPRGEKTNKQFGESFNYRQVKDYAEGMVSKWKTERQAPPKPVTRRKATLTDEQRQTWNKALDKGAVFIDLETTTFSPKSGHIIDLGMIDEQGNTYQSLYGAPAKHLEWNGTGAQDVHHIAPEDVAGKEQFLGNQEELSRVREFIGDRVLVAHNATFERTWLNANGLEGVDYADSMSGFAVFVPDAPGASDNKLSSLVEWSGGTYENAHRALPDAVMTKEAWENGLRDAVAQGLGKAA